MDFATNDGEEAFGLLEHRSSYLDASAFLELERGLSDKNKKELDGIEAAIAKSSSAPAPPASSTSPPPMRISKASLDKISAAAKAGSLATFGSFREETVHSMDSIRALQERIFEDHMRFDVFENNEIDLGAKDFLPRYTKEHAEKEGKMNEITSSLVELANQISHAGAQLVGVIDPLHPTAASFSSSSAAAAAESGTGGGGGGAGGPHITLRSVANRLIDHKRLERAKRQTVMKDLVKDIKLLDQINANSHQL